MVLRNTATGEREGTRGRGRVRGHRPHAEHRRCSRGQLELDANGYICTHIGTQHQRAGRVRLRRRAGPHLPPGDHRRRVRLHGRARRRALSRRAAAAPGRAQPRLGRLGRGSLERRLDRDRRGDRVFRLDPPAADRPRPRRRRTPPPGRARRRVCGSSKATLDAIAARARLDRGRRLAMPVTDLRRDARAGRRLAPAIQLTRDAVSVAALERRLRADRHAVRRPRRCRRRRAGWARRGRAPCAGRR